MSQDGPDPHVFYGETIPAQFNQLLESQEAAGTDGASVLEGMRAVNATIRVIVEGNGTFHLNIEGGRMSSGGSPLRPPFLTLVHDRAALDVIRRESGDSALGFLGGLAGLAGEMKLTQQRIDNLSELSGALRFERTGDDGFAILTHFGSGPIPDKADCSISIDGEAYGKLRLGELNPQDAFLGGQIVVEGDMQMAMTLALAALSPD